MSGRNQEASVCFRTRSTSQVQELTASVVIRSCVQTWIAFICKTDMAIVLSFCNHLVLLFILLQRDYVARPRAVKKCERICSPRYTRGSG
eukprot:m.47569 g.47569  ORF g.47569 m.47569 type:complete len:90 (-) comp7341_c0_seq2:1795-2064(-)